LSLPLPAASSSVLFDAAVVAAVDAVVYAAVNAAVGVVFAGCGPSADGGFVGVSG
jgi:hypothetical protein